VLVVVQEETLGSYLRRLRERADMSLRDVERATGGLVSNVYLSQLETGKRMEPSPRMLVALARAYAIPVRLLFEKAGYVDAPTASSIEVAFRQVLSDPEFQFGTGFPGDLDEAAKRTIIRLYERATGKTLLTDGD
jgi:transcriptional regulator with XRE-family HTH domain